MLERLRDGNFFQGAKYEIQVAAIFARSGFNIEWIFDQSKKHCEFIAVHRETKQRVAVEAKSRKRSGVLNAPGERQSAENIKVGVSKQIDEAIGQSPGNMPFVIFVDINMPHTPEVELFQKRWIEEVKKSLERYGIPTPEKPDPFNAIFVTNFSWHYMPNEEVATMPGEFLTVASLYPKNSILDSNCINLIHRSVGQYGKVPEEV